jgi:hypothetical protein
MNTFTHLCAFVSLPLNRGNRVMEGMSGWQQSFAGVSTPVA